MAILYYSEASPFARKIRITIKILGMQSEIQLQQTDTLSASPQFLRAAPLGKVPVFQTDDGAFLYDSRVIAEYLDLLASGSLFPSGADRFEALVQQALADGILDACLLQIYEVRFRPEHQRDAAWTDRQRNKVSRALAEAETLASKGLGAVHIGHIALACALGYLDLRFGGVWRDGHPTLVHWLNVFAERVPAFEETKARL